MKNKIIIGLSVTVALLILVGIIAALSVTIKNQKREISELKIKIEKAEREREAAERVAEQEKKINEKYKKEASAADVLSDSAVADFNELFGLYNDG